MTDAFFILLAIIGTTLGAAGLAAALLRMGAAYDKEMGLEAEERE